jgi:REP element-mobilizing transposase RayT
MVEVTCRTIHARLLLRPSPELNDLLVGVLGRAQRRHSMAIHAVVVMSNHVHLLLSPVSPQQLARFMEYFSGNLAREIARLHDWHDKVWAGRYRAIPISDEPAAQVDRLRYVLAHGAKEGFVAHPRAWPGVHSVDALVAGRKLEGTWHNRSAAYADNRRGGGASEAAGDSTAHCEREEVTLTPLPCLAGLTERQRREIYRRLLDEIVARARSDRQGQTPLGELAVRRASPHDRPISSKRSPAPRAHAASRAARLAMSWAYREFVAAFRAAADCWRRGDRGSVFPSGAFPPRPPVAAFGSA